MGFGLGAWLFLALLSYLGYDAMTLVAQGEGCLIERLGKFDRQLAPGLHLKLPLIDRVSTKTSLRERVLDVPAQRCISADNAPLTADAVVLYRIADLYRARYAIDDVETGISNLVNTQLRAEIGRLPLDSTFSARERLNSLLLKEANAVTSAWGIIVTRVDVRDIQPSPEILRSMELQLAAERKKRALVLDSEGRRTSTINDAEASQSAIVIQAKAEESRLATEAAGFARAVSTLASALGKYDHHNNRKFAAKLLLERQLLATHTVLAQSPNAKLISLQPPTSFLRSSSMSSSRASLSPSTHNNNNQEAPQDLSDSSSLSSTQEQLAATAFLAAAADNNL